MSLIARFCLSPLMRFIARARTLSTAAAFVALLSLSPVCGTFYPADSDKFAYAGRWELNPEERLARADWPCSGVQFNVATAAAGAFPIALSLKLDRVRVKVTVTNSAGIVESATIIQGNTFFDFAKKYEILLENKNSGTHTISVTKLTQAAPWGNGLGKYFTSVLDFQGVEIDAKVATLESPPVSSRRVSLIGASDTAGYCVDGTPETSAIFLNPWKYDNCDMTSHGVLGRRLKAEINVQAIAGIGLTQNAFASKPFMLGRDTMRDYYSRNLQTEEQPAEERLHTNFAVRRADPRWKLLQKSTEWRPDLVVVSLGGNDFNHQETVPSNATFVAAFEEFLLKVAKPYVEDGVPPTIVSVCGQGDPTEVERDPNNDRCRPCPHVEAATDSFQAKHGENILVEYAFIPCDGTVVTGEGDIGCDGHKNRLGQKKVADFLEPRLREIMGWSDPIEHVTEPPREVILKSPSSGGFALAVFFSFGLVAHAISRRRRRSSNDVNTAKCGETDAKVEVVLATK